MGQSGVTRGTCYSAELQSAACTECKLVFITFYYSRFSRLCKEESNTCATMSAAHFFFSQLCTAECSKLSVVLKRHRRVLSVLFSTFFCEELFFMWLAFCTCFFSMHMPRVFSPVVFIVEVTLPCKVLEVRDS